MVLKAKKIQLDRSEKTIAREPDLTGLINIIFLILIFFIVAGTLRPFSARDIALPKVERGAAAKAIPSRLVIDRTGAIWWGRRDVDLEQIAQRIAGTEMPNDGRPLTIVADGRIPGSRILQVARRLRRAGVEKIAVMVERGRR